ncbi:MAG TPA: hypothetical protein VMY77_02690 [Chitinophagaceae bacterium]|nr:hypothetical protein [Chitinophagaceae bacterium]
MAKGDYFFPLYYRRLLTSTIGWKDDEFGAYLRLLIYQFDNGSIPSDLKELQRIAPSIKKHWPLISKKFIDNGNGSLINDVMQDVVIDCTKRAQRARENGKGGGRPKTKYNNPTGTHSVNYGLRNQNPDESYLITNNQQLITNVIESGGGFFLNELPMDTELTKVEIINVQSFIEAVCDGKKISEEEVKSRWLAFKIDNFKKKEWQKSYDGLLSFFRHTVKNDLNKVNKKFDSDVPGQGNKVLEEQNRKQLEEIFKNQ